MKKHFVGLVAVVAAVVCFSFTSTKSEGPCDKAVYWFPIPANAALESCGDVQAYTQFATLIPADGASDASASNNASAVLPTASPFGCPMTNEDFVCALGYTQAQLHVVEVSSGIFKWVPIDTQDYDCCLKRTTE